jgi:hypothetical protein
MRNLFLVTALLLGGAGCTSADRDPSSEGARKDATALSARTHVGPVAYARALPVAAKRRVGFGQWPDHGELVGYSDPRATISEGAYTWHQVDLSERHAIAAIAQGHLSLTTPSGEKLDFRYERHIEHPGGDWTWVGRVDRDGVVQQAIITFGERAAFGAIDQDGKPALKLTMRDGKAWLVETDPVKLALVEKQFGGGHRDDFLIPSAAVGAATDSQSNPLAAAAVAAAQAATTVDVLVGYSNGFAAGLGGASQAQTRINNLVDIANQAYINSQIDARIRLVHAMQVNYPDNTDNGDALEKLTGTRTTPVDPAFNALRAARDQYGADLVSLVRKYDRQTQNGCGIAWLIGGDRQPYTTGSAGNGYSVVSDGRQQDGNTTYFCRDESFAHELGHNMGAQHDRETASTDGTLKYGAFVYSFGYKTDAAGGNFYDIMAYGDQGQTAYRVFSNPRVTSCGGRACGVENQADNARTLSQTMPTAAAFRATVVPEQDYADLIDARAQDVNGDGRSDLLWALSSNTDWAYWAMSGGSKIGGAGYSVSPEWRVVATGDFRGDGRVDLIWSDGAQMQMWEGNGSAFAGAAMRSYPAGYRLIAVGDVNGDGRVDLVWRDNGNTQIGIWLMNGPAIIGSAAAATSPGWKVLGSGDFDGNGRLDLLWTNDTSMQMWLGQTSGGFGGASTENYPTGWSLFGIQDVDGDNRDDLLWRYAPTGDVAYWRMNGGTRLSGLGFAASPAWRPIQVGDWNGDGRGDILWTDGQSMQMWLWNGSGFNGQAAPAYPGGWNLIHH